MNVLVVGCGSAGKRHLRNLLAMDGIGKIWVKSGREECVESVGGEGRVRIVRSLQEAEADMAIIANDPHEHVTTALELAEAGRHLLIEKPLSHSRENLDRLREAAARKRLTVSVGYNLRFLGVMEAVKKRLREGAIGTPYFARIEAGKYLPDWRPGRDYRECYSACKERGGGVGLDISHEIDYMCDLFGEPARRRIAETRVSSLEITSSDLFEGIFEYEGGFTCSVHLDYLEPRLRRRFRIVGSRGVLHCDIARRELRIMAGEREELLQDPELFDIERTYVEELRRFMEAVRDGVPPRVTLDDGIRVLRLLEDGDVSGA